MKKNLILSIILISLFTSCAKSFIQVFDITSTDPNILENENVFENDTVKITYSFWASNGVISFSIYNKLSKPIYVDWKNSSLILNDNKLNYWIDELQTNQTSYYGNYLYSGPLISPFVFINEGIQVSTSNTVKPERITFIPPKSFTTKSQFILFPDKYYQFSNNLKEQIEPRSDKPSKKTKVFVDNFSYSNSPLRFRNYLTISFNENTQQFYFADNEFFLSSVKEMDYLHYQGMYKKNMTRNESYYDKPFRKRSSFFIKLEWRTIKN